MNWLKSRSSSSASSTHGEESQENKETQSQATPSEEEVRRKRLARFEVLNKGTSRSTVEPKEQQTTASKKESFSKEQADSHIQSSSTSSMHRNQTSLASSNDKNFVAAVRSSSTAVASTQGSKQSLEQLQEQIICRILRITLNEQTSSEELIFMKDLKEEWLTEKSSSEVLVTKDRADRIIFERLLQTGSGLDPLRYLLESYQRAADQESLLSISFSAEVKQPLLDTVTFVKKLIVSYLGLLLSNSELFYTDSPMYRSAHFMEALVEDRIPAGLLKDIVTRFEEEDDNTLAEIFYPIMELLCSKAMKTSLLKGNFAAALRALGGLLSFKSLAILFTRHRNFNLSEERISQPSVTGRSMEMETLLGPFFRLTALKDDDEIANTLFSNPRKRTRQDVDQSMSSLRASLKVLRHGLHEILLSLLKASPESRESVLKWFATFLHFDKERVKLQADYKKLATDGFAMNVLSVLLLLSQPFADPRSPKLDNIDPTFCVSKHRIDYSGETRLAVDSEDLARWVDPKNPNAQVSFQNMKRQQAMELANSGTSTFSDQKTDSIQVKDQYHFITECFFLALRSCQLVFGGTIQMYQEHILRGMQHLYSLQRDMESSQMSASSRGGPLASIMEARLNEVNRQLDLLIVQKLSYDVYLQDEELLSLLLQFCATVASWLLRIAFGNQIRSSQDLKLPLPTPPPTLLCTLPEHTVEVVADALLFCARFCPSTLDSVSFIHHEMLGFLCAIVSSPLHVRNPYLRSKFVEFLWAILGDPPSPQSPQEEWISRSTAWTASFESNPVCQKYLPGALVRLYVEVEHTGSHSQFYDKFSIRYHITCIFYYMWHLSTYRTSIRYEAENESVFVKFVNMLLNDATYLLDEALGDLTEIHSLQERLDENGSSSDSTERQEQQSRLSQLERVRKVFLKPEMVTRLAEMLNYFLLQLCGPKCQSLVVRNREQYAWEPRVLLTQIVGIYLHFREEEDFAKSVAKDGRSYSQELFERALDIVHRRRLLSDEECHELQLMMKRFQEFEKLESEDEDLVRNAPEEFLDPIMATIMREPVLLPTSRTIVDLSTISRHLLSDPSDPFNREFLSMEMLQPQEELKRRIEDYIASKQKK
ncbi:Probable ubiquitin conjugation factor E4 [Galdieria sulphuraria]|nr:Probable ubiquitin conjugation factor E4 [Galdieria sulphuraria]